MILQATSFFFIFHVNATEHEILTAHKTKTLKKKEFTCFETQMLSW